MKKRTMAAFASLATGVVTALITPNAHAADLGDKLSELPVLGKISTLDTELNTDGGLPLNKNSESSTHRM
ncbi:hypothetical protein NX801_16810 [Streptomyces sp. LP05-1]|uniref:Secreted protein n=1 Tax=Streptomyces pyxinae TaxID=2970734 RepID=A0ABT2CIQ6_9ACTN|nr:hypothetical protein [Streptomyces sp. LP05-1]MCS0637295.1 hypothetical protein [Streptomyces sp. LP05-1]